MVKEKKKFKDIEVNDAFAVPVEADKGSYFVFIKMDKVARTPMTAKYFRVKYVEKGKDIHDFKVIDSCPYIPNYYWYNLDKAIFDPEGVRKVKPDEYGFIYRYYFEFNQLDRSIKPSKRCFDIPNNWIYLGNFKFMAPDNEYTADDGDLLYIHNYQERLFWRYDNIVLKKGWMYTEEGQKKLYERAKSDSAFLKPMLKFVLDEKNAPVLEEIFGKEKPTSNSLTYVGPEEEREKYEEKKK